MGGLIPKSSWGKEGVGHENFNSIEPLLVRNVGVTERPRPNVFHILLEPFLTVLHFVHRHKMVSLIIRKGSLLIKLLFFSCESLLYPLRFLRPKPINLVLPLLTSGDLLCVLSEGSLSQL